MRKDNIPLVLAKLNNDLKSESIKFLGVFVDET